MNIETLNDLPNTSEYLRRINAEPRSMQKAVVREEHSTGYWLDVAIIKFDKKGGVEAPVGYGPTEAEQEKITLEFAGIDWPETVFIDMNDREMPRMVTEAPSENVFVFKDVDGNIIMVQVRKEQKGKKSYIPVTKWSDGKFRFLEPEGRLPLFGMENLKQHSTVLIVEGAKVARYVQWLSDGATPEARKAREDHPWGRALTNLCVLGWCSGALSPARTDWEPIRKHGITRAYVSLDNDSVGREALRTISKNLRCVTHSIEFTDDWPMSADLYDPFPEKYFKEIDGKKYYTGPTFNECTHPATFMTDKVPNPEDPKKELIVLRHHARGLWHYIEETESFCYIEKPDIVRKPDALDAMIKPFYDGKKISELLLNTFNGRITTFDYLPETTARKVISNGRPVINLYTPSNVEPRSGDYGPWLEFLEQLFPIERERHLVMRWIATLYAKPEVRMIYALLLVSSETGTGKSSLGNIIAQLVGVHNTSFPSESTLAEPYNNWIARKRAVICNEIYSGASFKMFNKLKDLITEPTITLRQMYRDGIDMRNWAHFVLCSNSFQPLKLDEKDRRIFAPTVTETRWPDEKWEAFHNWIAAGGIQIIAHWCVNFGDYVKPGERSPMTERKQEMIESSRSKASVRAEELSGLMNDYGQPVALADKSIKGWLENITKERVYESELEIRKLMTKAGATEFKCLVDGKLKNERLSFESQMANVLLSRSAAERLENVIDTGERREYVRSILKRPNEILNWE
jgi:hypothetical protein